MIDIRGENIIRRVNVGLARDEKEVGCTVGELKMKALLDDVHEEGQCRQCVEHFGPFLHGLISIIIQIVIDITSATVWLLSGWIFTALRVTILVCALNFIGRSTGTR